MAKEKVKKPFYKRWWVWLIAIIIVIGMFSGNDDSKETSGEPQVVEEEGDTKEKEDDSNEDEENEENIEDKKFGIGEKVELDGHVVEVTEVEKSSGDDFDKPSEGKEFVIVHISIENNSDDEISYNPFNFKMKNSNGQIEEQTFTTIDSDTSLSSGELASGGNVEGTIPFEQPIDDDELQLIFEPSFWKTSEIVFNLQ